MYELLEDKELWKSLFHLPIMMVFIPFLALLVILDNKKVWDYLALMVNERLHQD